MRYGKKRRKRDRGSVWVGERQGGRYDGEIGIWSYGDLEGPDPSSLAYAAGVQEFMETARQRGRPGCYVIIVGHEDDCDVLSETKRCDCDCYLSCLGPVPPVALLDAPFPELDVTAEMVEVLEAAKFAYMPFIVHRRRSFVEKTNEELERAGAKVEHYSDPEDLRAGKRRP